MSFTMILDPKNVDRIIRVKMFQIIVIQNHFVSQNFKNINQIFPDPSRFTESSSIPSTPPSTATLSLPIFVNGSQVVNWCFQCSSPMKILSEPMQQAIQNLLDVRRSQMPKGSIVYDCHQPANIKTLPKVQCLHSYCQTLVLTEHERGLNFPKSFKSQIFFRSFICDAWLRRTFCGH